MSQLNQYQSEQNSLNNQMYQHSSVIEKRLDTTQLLDSLEAFFRGTRLVGYKEDENTIKPIFADIGKPRMNDIGIQALMSWLTALLNPQTVQGNKSREEYEDFMARLEGDLSDDLMINLHVYGIEESDYQGVVDMSMSTCDMFFSRTIDNKERESYANTMKSIERVGGDQNNKGWLQGAAAMFKRS